MTTAKPPRGWIERLIHASIHHPMIVGLLLLLTLIWGAVVTPFDIGVPGLPRDPVSVDAIPDIGENQQIVFTSWPGRSPQDVEDQISFPLTTALMGIPGVKTLRTHSSFGSSSIYVIFEEKIDFYWSRSRLVEKLASLPPHILPRDVTPTLGPDATALGQVFWYTLEGRDEEGRPAGGWDLETLRSIQDWQVRTALQAAEGVAEVASVGGFVKEMQVDLDPDAMRIHGISLEQAVAAVRQSNLDVGARSLEINGTEFVLRGLGTVDELDDLRRAVVKSVDHVPLTLEQIADVTYGPALRRGVLDKGGSEAVGGVVVARHGANPLQTIESVKRRIHQISASLPEKVLGDGRTSKVTIVPFYDRSELIEETLDTLKNAISDQILVTVAVILCMIFHLRSAGLISLMLPLTVWSTFIAMHALGVSANIVALSGIAIAIGTIVDMGIVMCESIHRRRQMAPPDTPITEVVFEACREVGGAVFTAVATTVVSFLPVFVMVGSEGKLFKPLATTKTLTLLAAILLSLTVLPAMARLLFHRRWDATHQKRIVEWLLLSLGVGLLFTGYVWPGILLMVFVAIPWLGARLGKTPPPWLPLLPPLFAASMVMWALAQRWLPLGYEAGSLSNAVFVILLVGTLLLAFRLLEWIYPTLLDLALRHKLLFMALPILVVLWGAVIWVGFSQVFFFLPENSKRSELVADLEQTFPGLGKEFMPNLDEGAFLYMPTTMPHASVSEVHDIMAKVDLAIESVPEVDEAVGKLGRVESALDPAPISMIETIINLKSEYRLDEEGMKLCFAYDTDHQVFLRDEQENLIPDPEGRPYRQWRPHIRNTQDIWDEIVATAQVPGLTSAPKLQPISARIVMLQTGLRAPMGLKIEGPDLATIEEVGLEIEKQLKGVFSISPATVFADRIVGKPYLEFDIDREAIARYGLTVADVQKVIETALGGVEVSEFVQGRERYPIRVRYQRERRDHLEAIDDIMVASPDGAQIPLGQLGSLFISRGPMVIKSEDGFLLGYVLFDKRPGFADVDVVRDARLHLESLRDQGLLSLPAGVHLSFVGSFQQQERAEETLMVILPVTFLIIFILLYLQFHSLSHSILVFVGVFVAWAGGFQMLWLFQQSGFLNVELFDTNMRDLFNMSPTNLSVAVWVGFLALFGIATDDGVLMLTMIRQGWKGSPAHDVEGLRQQTIASAQRRLRPCLMTSATTILALLPILSSMGKGSEVMIPMAIPSIGGMSVVMLTVFIVPVLACWLEEIQLKRKQTS